MKHPLLITFVVLLAAGLAAGVFVLTRGWGSMSPSPPPDPAATALPTTEASAAAQALPRAEENPLTRDAIAGRDYPPSPIAIEQDLGQAGGFHSYVISYRSDGHKIRALLNVPGGAQPPRGWPVIIFNHGYIPPDEYRTTGPDYRYWIEGLTRAGYIVIKPDFRGHDQSEGEAGNGNFSPEYTYDVLTLVSSVGNWPGADPERVGMAGHSMGGSVALRAITGSDRIKATAILAGVVGTAEDVYFDWPQPPGETGGLVEAKRRLAERYGDPRTNPGLWNSIMPITYVRYLNGPVQIHHAADDPDVPKLFSDSLAGALRAAGKPVEYFEYPGGGHQFVGYGGVVLERMVGLFDSRLK